MSTHPSKALDVFLRGKEKLLLKVPKEMQCRKCGTLDILPGTEIVPLGYYPDDIPPVIEIGINCPKCHRHCPADVEIEDEERMN